MTKHDAVQNFTASLNTADWNRQVPVEQLDGDLSGGRVPSFGYIIPTECSDQHGDPPFCIDSGNPDGGNLSAADPQDQRLVAQGDAYLGRTVSEITNASFWARGNNAIVVARVGKDLLLKRLKMRQRKIFLHPDPPGFPVIELGEHDEIWGIVTHCIHRVR